VTVLMLSNLKICMGEVKYVKGSAVMLMIRITS
jgi:hypothetical protein